MKRISSLLVLLLLFSVGSIFFAADCEFISLCKPSKLPQEFLICLARWMFQSNLYLQSISESQLQSALDLDLEGGKDRSGLTQLH